MNMISTGAFLNEMDASNKQPTAAEKFAAVWEKKNAKAARAGGVSLMALSLAACGGSSSTTTTSTTDTTTDTTTTTTPATFDLTPLNDVASGTMALNGSLSSEFRFTDGNEVVNGITATMSANDVLIDGSSTDNDTLNITATGTTAITTVKIETVNVDAASGTVLLDASAMTGVTSINVSGAVAAEVDNAASGATIKADGYGRIINVDADDYAGTTAAKNPDTVNLEVAGGTWGSTAATQTGFSLTADTGAVIETLNVTSSGATANTFNLDASTNVTLSTVNFLGAADATVRVAAGDVTGKTLVATAATGEVALRIDTNSTSAAVNAANFSGIDNFIMADSTVGSENASISSLASGNKITMVDDFAAEDTTLTVKGATYTAPAASLTIVLDNETANTDVDMQKIDAQNVSALNIESSGFSSSSTAATAVNLIDDLVGDATTITITGDTSLDLDANIDGKQTASGTDAARTVAVDASGMTGTAFLDFAGAANTKVTYTVVGTDNNDTLVANNTASTLTGNAGNDTLTGGNGVDTINGGAGKDHIDVSYGLDKLTGGDGADTYDINSAKEDAVAKVVTANVEGASTATVVSAADAIVAVIDGTTYRTAATGTAHDTNLIDVFIAEHVVSIKNAHGITVAANDASGADGIKFTGKADGTDFTVDVSFEDDATMDAVTETTATAAVTAKDVASTVTDFAAGDIIDVAGLSLTADGGYYEGAVGSFTAATEYQFMVITDQSALTDVAMETLIAARYGGTDADSQIFVYLNATDGNAKVVLDSNIHSDDASTLNQLMTLENITTLADLAAAFTSDSGVVA